MKLTVVFTDTYRNTIALVHENEYFPYKFRTVQIKLTEEQIKQLQPKYLGNSNGCDYYEELYNSWIESEV